MRYAQLPVAILSSLLSCFFADAHARAADSSRAGDGDAHVERRKVAAGEGSSGAGDSVHGTIGRAAADASHPAWSGAFALTGGPWASAEPVDTPGDTLLASGFE